MNRTQIRQRLAALAKRAKEALADLASSDPDKVRKAKAENDKALAEFDTLKRALDAHDTVAAIDAAAEQRESDAQFSELVADAGMADYTRAMLADNGLTGAARELNDELGAVAQRGGIVVPWAVLERAATTTTQIDGADNQRPIVQRVFARSLAPYFGVQMRSVGVGTTELPILTGKGSVVEQLTEGAAPSSDPTAASFDTLTLKPKRLTGEMEVTAEAMAQVAGLERALATDTLAEINDAVSGALLTGDGVTPNVHGFFSRVAEPGDPAAEAALADFRDIASSNVDGLYATSESDVAILFGVAGYAKAASTFFSTQDDRNATSFLRDAGASLQVSAKVPASGGTGNATAKAKRQAIVVRRGRRANQSFAAMWNAGPEMIRDPYTKADSATLKVVWHLLWDANVATRTAEWRRLLIQHAA